MAACSPGHVPAPNREAPVRKEPERRAASLPAAPLPAAPKISVGMTRERVEALLGSPAFLRREPPAEFRRYRSENCILELYFYPRGRHHVLKHLEVRESGGREIDSAHCLKNIASDPQG